jgi:lysozyme
MTEAMKRVLLDQPLRKEPRRLSESPVSPLGETLRVLAGELVKIGAKPSQDEILADRTITWVFVEATGGQLLDLRKGFVSEGTLVSAETPVGISLGFQPFAEQVEKESFANACCAQAMLSNTNPAYLYALAFALSGDQWSPTHVRANDSTIGVFRFPNETWQSLLSDPELVGMETDQIKFPNAQCIVAAVVAEKSAELLKSSITDRSLSAVDLFLAHVFADGKDFGSNATAKIRQAEKDHKDRPSAAVIEAEIYPESALRTAFFKRNADIFREDGSASIEQALKACANKLDSGFAEVARLAKDLEAKEDQDSADCPASLLKSSIPASSVGPLFGGVDGSAATGIGGGVVEAQQGATRRLPISQELHDILEFAGRKTGIDTEVYSGGQPPTGPNRTGSHRHDVGGDRMGAADLLMRDAKTKRILDSADLGDRARIAKFIEESAAAGAIGIGHAAGYMGTTRTHIGGGNPEAVWGTGASRSGAPAWVVEAFQRGRAPARRLNKAQVAAGLAQMRNAAPTGKPQVPAEGEKGPDDTIPPAKPGAKKLADKGAALVKAFESCMKAVPGGFQAYLDPVGVLTIGWGHTNHNGRKFKSGEIFTQAECDAEFLKDMAVFEKAVNDRVKVPLNQDQFDALVSFAFNVGAGNLAQSTLLRKLNAGDFVGAAQEFQRWNKAGGKVLRGLTRRRASEALLFQSIPDKNFDGIPD